MSASATDGVFPSIPGFRIEAVLGRGSMATVYRATQLGMDRPVALKILHEDVVSDDKIVRRLMREAKLAARFNHPHIVRAHDAGVHAGQCYFVMEYIEGASIRDLLERRGPIAPRRAVRWAIEVAEALGHFYQGLVVHRDVKPANIMIDREGKALLADLGLAKVEFDSSMTSKDRSVGTPAYMSPEQARDPNSVDARSDIFSLGATLYHMVTGVSPFDGPSVGAVLTRILYEEPPGIRELDPSLPASLEAVVTRMLEKERSQRYQSPAALLRDLRALERGAAPPGEVSSRRRARERRVTLAVICGLAVIVVAAGVWALRGRGDPARSDIESSDSAPAPPPEPGELDRPALFDRVVELRGDAERCAPYLEELQSRVERDVEEHFRPALELARGGALVEARDLVDGELERSFARLYGRDFESLARWMQVRLESGQRAARSEIDRLDAAIQQRVLDAGRDRLAAAVESILRSRRYHAPDELAELLAKTPIDGTDRLGEASAARLDRLRKDAAAQVVSGWKQRLDERLDDVRAACDARRYREARVLVDSELQRGPERADPALRRRLMIVAADLDEAEASYRRTLVNVVDSVDHVAARGHKELARREFGEALGALGRRVAELPDDREDLGRAAPAARLLDVVYRTIKRADTLFAETAKQLETVADGKVSVACIDGSEILDAELVSVDEVRLLVRRPGRSEPDEVPMRALSVDTLLLLVTIADAAERDRCAAFLHYCDGDLLSAEDALARLGEDDRPFRDFLGGKIEEAFPALNRVTTPAEKEAFVEWSGILTDYRQRRWPEVHERTRALIRNRRWNRTEWYVAQRKKIARVYDEAKVQVDMATRLGARAGRYQLVDPERRIVEAWYSFDAARELADFRAPPDAAVTGGHYTRRRAEADGHVTPDHVAPLALDFPIALGSGFDLELVYLPSRVPDLAPRCLTLSAFGHHVAVLSRLRANRHQRHRPLHGMEKVVHRFITFGDVASWSGPLRGYEKAFRSLADRPRVLFEPGGRYVVRLVLDAKTRALTLMVDGKVRLSRKGIDLGRTADRTIAIRAPMPHRIDSLRFRGALAAD